MVCVFWKWGGCFRRRSWVPSCATWVRRSSLEPAPQGIKPGVRRSFRFSPGKRLLSLPSANRPAAWPYLLPHTDILILNHRPATLSALHLVPETLLTTYPHLITVNLLGHEDGRPGHDLNFLAESGVLDRLRPAPDAPPIVPGFLFGDLLGGTASALIRVLAALYQREKTGRGLFSPWPSLPKCCGGAMPQRSCTFLGRVRCRRLRRSFFGGLPAYRVYRTKDHRYMVAAALESHFWEGFCQHIGRPDLIPLGYALNDLAAHIAIEALFQSKTFSEWEALLRETAFCVSPVYTFAEAIQQPWAASVWREKFLTFSDSQAILTEPGAPGADNARLRESLSLPADLFA